MYTATKYWVRPAWKKNKKWNQGRDPNPGVLSTFKYELYLSNISLCV